MKKYIPLLFIIGVVAYLLLLVRPAFLGQLKGTFSGHLVPAEYIKLEGFLNSQSIFSRTLWVPSTQRFGFYSSIHPAISAKSFYHVASASGVLDSIKKSGAEKQLQDTSVKYVIVPFDSEGEIFLKDRKYDNASYEEAINQVKKIYWLHEIQGFGRIHVFEIKNPKDHFWTDDSLKLSYQCISPTEYIVKVENAQKGDRIIFAESYDSGWKGIIGKAVINSQPFEKSLNSFVLSKDGDYKMRIYYQPQEWVNRGLWISGISLITLISLLIGLGVQKKNNKSYVGVF